MKSNFRLNNTILSLKTPFIWRKISFVILSVFLISNSIYGQSWEHPLTGKWGGFRDSIGKKGIHLQPRMVFFQHNFVQGTGNDASIYAGKADVKATINGVGLGIKRWTLITQIEQNFGKSLNASGGVVIPLNTATTFPGINEANAFDITSLYFIYQFGKKNALMFGKINVIDLAATSTFSGGAGIDSFWNMNFAAPVSGITPAYILGSIASVYSKKFKYTFMVYDPVGVVNRSGLESPFSRGITLSASIEKAIKIGNMDGTHVLKATFSTQDGSDLYDLGDIFFPTTKNLVSQKNNRYYFSYKFTQQLANIGNDKKGWGLFGQVGISDGNPNPVNFGANLGIGGNSFIKNRIDDKWGLGIYHYSLSAPVDDYFASLGFNLRNETGFELFYQAWITHWFSFGANAQYIIPMVKDNQNALFLGIRSSIHL